MSESYVWVGDNREALREMPGASVQCCVTSPPYWGLRDYGTVEWKGGDPDHDHDAAVCSCGAVRIDRQLGLEPTPEAYVESIVGVLREVRRVLRDDGTLWLNLGDSYARAPEKGGSGPNGKNAAYSDSFTLAQSARAGSSDGIVGRGDRPGSRASAGGLKPKDLVGIPWRVALALQADGWWLRSDTIWSKPNPMPESVRDRPTKAHEYLFLLTKSARYFYDDVAVAEPSIHAGRVVEYDGTQRNCGVGDAVNDWRTVISRTTAVRATRNRRSVWNISTVPFAEAHFATFPPALVEPCILAGTSERGACVKCGAPWKRVTKRVTRMKGNAALAGAAPDELNTRGKWRNGGSVGNRNLKAGPVVFIETIGWKPRCKCAADTEPCTVLDPFFGAGTTGLVAQRLGRRWIGCELNEEYAEMAMRRIHADAS